ncbi:flavin reductase family protein [Burkholderia gladioli]|uniref:flavin reductase family protein n=1 Tax=Burkholderia gladioli TaxID=28095 RepID=UPI001ABA27D6|nr:flavin reductase family protein [Burkholderia gladioli]
MRKPALRDIDPSRTYRLLESGPVVLVVTHDGRRANVMTMGFHMVMRHSPPLVGAIIGPWDHSHAALRETGECVLAVPGADWAVTLVEIGNCSGAELDKFERFGLATAPSKQVAAPRLADCLYNIECVIEDDTLAERHDLFVLRAVAAAVNDAREERRVLHHRGDGTFAADGEVFDLRERMHRWKAFQVDI